MKINRFIISLFTLFLASYPALCSSSNDITTLGDISSELGLSLEEISDYHVYKNILREGSENTFWTVAAKKNGRIVKIETIKNIDEKTASRYVEERKHLIESLYKRIPSPYPGMVSKTIECPEKFTPEIVSLKIENKTTPIYILSSTPRFTYGACADELIKYRGYLAFIYNEKGKILYRVEIFIPVEEFDKKWGLSLLGSLKFNQPIKAISKKPVVAEIIRDVKAEQKRIAAVPADLGNFSDYNLIIIGFDPLGAKHMGAYGYPKNTTPNFDAFSRKSFLFKNATSPSSWTLPVFMSWFTSLYPSQHKLINKYKTYTDEKQVLSNLSDLSPSAITLAQVLKKNGYATAGFTGDAGVGSDYGYNLGFDVYYDKTTFGGFDIVLPKALNWLLTHKQEKFFLFLQGYDVHGRYKAAKDLDGKFENPDYKGKYKGTVEEYWKLRNLSLDKKLPDMTAEDVDFWRSWYDKKIFEADKRLGIFLKEFEKFDAARKTIIVISSASGNEFYEHKRFDHGYSLYEELIHVPLAIYVPDKKGRIIEEPVRTLDIMPTVLDLLNINNDKIVTKQMQGVSLVALMEGEVLHLNAFSETDYLLQTYKRALRTYDGWKFIYTMDSEKRELYNLNIDPHELNNLVEKEKRVAYELEQELFNWLSSMGQGKYYYKKIMQNMLTTK